MTNMLPLAGVGASLKGGVGWLLGKRYPTKLNRGGRQQPYDPNTGCYKSYDANPGLSLSPLSRFGAGFTQGYSEAKGASGGSTPVGRAGNIGYMIGQGVGNLPWF